eukprot:COSAG02_NODE_59054_length_275_cov_0.875000_1_plen_42_part_10
MIDVVIIPREVATCAILGNVDQRDRVGLAVPRLRSLTIVDRV